MRAIYFVFSMVLFAFLLGCAKGETDIAPPDIANVGQVSSSERVVACSAKTFPDSNETLHLDILKSKNGKPASLYIYRTVVAGSRSSGWAVSHKAISMIEFDNGIESQNGENEACRTALKRGEGAEVCTQKIDEVLPANIQFKFFYREGSKYSVLWRGGNESLLIAKTADATYFVDCKKQILLSPSF